MVGCSIFSAMSPERDVALLENFVQKVSEVQFVQKVSIFSAISPARDVAFLENFVQKVSEVQFVQ